MSDVAHIAMNGEEIRHFARSGNSIVAVPERASFCGQVTARDK
jgi:hypothetical protein